MKFKENPLLEVSQEKDNKTTNVINNYNEDQ